MATAYAPGQLPPVSRQFVIDRVVQSLTSKQYFVNPPMDQQYIPYMAPGHAQGQPHHAPVDNMQGVPLYNDSDEKIPDYSGPTSDAYLPHEKERFEDVKV